MSNNHLSPEKGQSYIQFELNEDENERIIAHLSECDACLSLVDAEWTDESQPAPNLENSNVKKRLINPAKDVIGLPFIWRDSYFQMMEDGFEC